MSDGPRTKMRPSRPSPAGAAGLVAQLHLDAGDGRPDRDHLALARGDDAVAREPHRVDAPRPRAAAPARAKVTASAASARP